MMFIIIFLAVFLSFIVYILVRHFQGAIWPDKAVLTGEPVSLVDTRFSPTTGALKIGDETISYYSYAQQPDIVVRIEEYLRRGLQGRSPVPGGNGKVARVATTLAGWRLLPVMLFAVGILIFALLIWKGVLLPKEQWMRPILAAVLFAAVVMHLLLSMVHQSILTRWELRDDHLYVGKWRLRSAVPIRQITALRIEIAREKWRRQARQPGFVLEVKHGEQKTRFHDMRLGNLLPLYDAMIVRRPDLKIV